MHAPPLPSPALLTRGLARTKEHPPASEHKRHRNEHPSDVLVAWTHTPTLSKRVQAATPVNLGDQTVGRQ